MSVIINNHYPLDYFAIVQPSQQAPASEFWASEEALAPAEESLELDFGRFRPVNFIDFQICQKPIDFKIYYHKDDDWVEIVPNNFYPVSFAVTYIESTSNPWAYFECRFNLVNTRRIKVVFTRRTEPFPYHNTPVFPWSIEVKSLRCMHVIQAEEDFEPDTGTDILDNSFVTDFDAQVADNVIDGDDTTYWQSQANPRPDAVEALFFDLRGGYQSQTMAQLDKLIMKTLDQRGMLDMEQYYPDGLLFDEIFVDPITSGPIVHIYYSNDDEPDPNYKLWTPVGQHFILRRGYLSLPRPIFCKYVKLEFSRLAAAPYNNTQYPESLPVFYRRFPTWVQDYFTQVFEIEPDNTFVNPRQNVEINLIDMGYQSNTELDLFDTQYEIVRNPVLMATAEDSKDFISAALLAEDRDSSQLFDQVNFNSSLMWQSDLKENLDQTRALTRFVFTDQSGWQIENPLPTYDTVTVQSEIDMTEHRKHKERPIMYFPRKCRHRYQEVLLPRTENICYFVAIREVIFYRRDYRLTNDDPYYVETFEDEIHTDQNEFTAEEWRMVVTP